MGEVMIKKCVCNLMASWRDATNVWKIMGLLRWRGVVSQSFIPCGRNCIWGRKESVMWLPLVSLAFLIPTVFTSLLKEKKNQCWFGQSDS